MRISDWSSDVCSSDLAQGIDVHRLRTGAVMLGSAFMAVGGAFLTISVFDAFYIGMINGRGWICIALIISASWRPGKPLACALLFAAVEALQIRVQPASASVIPSQFFIINPYLLYILTLFNTFTPPAH